LPEFHLAPGAVGKCPLYQYSAKAAKCPLSADDIAVPAMTGHVSDWQRLGEEQMALLVIDEVHTRGAALV
jgi:hypothetical protein